jgi:uncharacterized protein
VKPYIDAAIDQAKSNLSLESAFTSAEAPTVIQAPFRQSLAEFLSDPTAISDAYLTKIQAMKNKKVIAPPPAETGASTTGSAAAPVEQTNEREDKLVKGLETKIDRKRREIKDKYRKRKYVIFI